VGGGAKSARRAGASTNGGRADRRLARGTATRDAILGAAVELLQEENQRPTSYLVASRAGVSRRLVFYHFARVDGLVLRAVESQLARQPTLILALPPRWPIDVRIDSVCRQRRDLFELLGPIYGAAVRLGDRRASPQSRPLHLADLRRQLAVTFAPEIDQCGDEGPMLLQCLDAVTSWEHWHILRTREGLTPPAAERSTVWLVRQVLAGS
jgi:AcrR family transcriptional regulator